MTKFDPNKVGLIVAAFFGLTHLSWAILVAIGLAQTLQDFVFSIHFLNNPFTVGSFDPVKALVLVGVTSLVGYVVGWVIAVLWNKMHGKK